MLDMLKILLCGAGALYLATRIGGLVRAVVRGTRMATIGNTSNDNLVPPVEGRSAELEPAIAK